MTRRRLGGEEHTVGQGATANVPPGTWMALANRGATSAVVLVVVSRGEVEECFRVLFSTDADEAERRKATRQRRLRFPPASR